MLDYITATKGRALAAMFVFMALLLITGSLLLHALGDLELRGPCSVNSALAEEADCTEP